MSSARLPFKPTKYWLGMCWHLKVAMDAELAKEALASQVAELTNMVGKVRCSAGKS